MNRTHKYRAWDTKSKTFWYSDQCKNLAEFFAIVEDLKAGGNEVVLQEWTGIADKAEKEIYEQDILKLENSLLTVEFINGAFFGLVHIAGNNGDRVGLRYSPEFLHMFTIIGNSMQNPELLQ